MHSQKIIPSIPFVFATETEQETKVVSELLNLFPDLPPLNTIGTFGDELAYHESKDCQFGRRILLNEKTMGCTCEKVHEVDEVLGINTEYLTMSTVTLSSKEPPRFKSAKNDGTGYKALHRRLDVN